MVVADDMISFVAASAGTGDFAFGSSRASFLTLAQAVTNGDLVDQQWVSYSAVDSLLAPTQREYGMGIFSSAGSGTVARTNVFGGTSGAATLVNFSSAPVVSITILAEDVYFANAGESGAL